MEINIRNFLLVTYKCVNKVMDCFMLCQPKMYPYFQHRQIQVVSQDCIIMIADAKLGIKNKSG